MDSVPGAKYRWPITIGITVAFTIVGFVLGWSIDTKFPEDRFADIAVPTMLFLTVGLIVGFVSALVISRQFKWYEAIASLAIAPLLFAGFLLTKLGATVAGLLLGLLALAVMPTLIFRLIFKGKIR